MTATFLNTDAVQRPIGAVLLDTSDGWRFLHRSIQVERIAGLVREAIEVTITLPHEFA
ncbi:hypothetical protein [Methylobacterium crusticola]|uniref:hypothetical protein n=1 Tax=Methylobacterium crusticola TaxID=1697972 RepID=UPI001396A602|nr:hypothetical protein [Methylobacterium crusticola]